MKILIVEDEPSLRELIQRSLEKERYVVETAGDFNSALYKIEDYDYDCVLLDIMLPDGSGHFWTPVGVRIHVQSGLRILAALAIAACAAVLTRKKGGHAAAIRSVQPERIPLAEKRCTTLNTSLKFPLIYFCLAASSPFFSAAINSSFSCSRSIGSLAVLTPQISTLYAVIFHTCHFNSYMKYL